MSLHFCAKSLHIITASQQWELPGYCCWGQMLFSMRKCDEASIGPHRQGDSAFSHINLAFFSQRSYLLLYYCCLVFSRKYSEHIRSVKLQWYQSVHLGALVTESISPALVEMKVTGAMGRQKQNNPPKGHGFASGGHRQLRSSYLSWLNLL